MGLGGQVNKIVNYTFRLNGANQTGMSMRSVANAAAGMATAAVAAGTALFALTDRLTRTPALIQDMSNRTGVAASELAALGYIAEQDGAALESLQTGIRTMSSAITDANAGLATYQRSFEQLGVDYTELARMNFRGQFDTIADAIAGLEDETLKMSIAQDLFGRGGMVLIPTLERGAAGLAEMTAEAERLGIVLGDDAYAQSKAFQDALTQLRGELTGLLVSQIVPLLPQIKDMAETFLNAAVTVIPQLVTALGNIVPVAIAVANAVSMAADGLGRLQGQDKLDAWIAIQIEAHQTVMTIDQVTAALDRMYAAWPGLRPSGSVDQSVFGGAGALPSIFNQVPSLVSTPAESAGGGGSPLTPMVKDAKDIATSFEGIKAIWEDMGKDAITGDVLRMQEEKGQVISDALALQAERSREISDLLNNGARDFVRTLISGGDDWGERMLEVIGKMALKFAAMQVGGPIGGFLGAFL